MVYNYQKGISDAALEVVTARLAESDGAQSLLDAFKLEVIAANRKYAYLPTTATEAEKAAALLDKTTTRQAVIDQAALIPDAVNAYTQSKAAY